MPQVDLTTFLPQIFWLVLLFGFFYTLILRDVFFVIYSTLYIRSKILQHFVRLKDFLADENAVIFGSYLNYFVRFLQTIVSELSLRINIIDAFLSSVIKLPNITKIYTFASVSGNIFVAQNYIFKFLY